MANTLDVPMELYLRVPRAFVVNSMSIREEFTCVRSAH